MRKTVYETINDIAELPTKKDRVEALQKDNNPTIKTILKYCFDPSVKWLLPKGEVPYKPNKNSDQRNMLYSRARELYLFVEGGNPNLRQMRREELFINLLESIDEKDAELICAIKDKEMPMKGYTLKVVMDAFPDLIDAPK